MYEEVIKDSEEYRDSISTVDKDGKRVWIYPKMPQGKFYNWRQWVSYVYILFFLAVPFIKYQGEPILLFNVLERKFIIFGLLFGPQDFHLFFLTMITFVVFIILFTVVWGRLFCGWICPQTIFMEMIFRRVEYAIDGDANEQRKLDKAPMSGLKLRKRLLKHAIFFAISVVVANYFLAYVIGMDAVLKIVTEPVNQNMGGFVTMLGFSGIFYGVFARLREQVCTTICPYGRLQGVLLVQDSVVVAYDHVRGEPRGKIKKQNPLEQIQNAVKLGDCVDCKLCVAVCPTGIDIRNGTQLECTNCTACIDACDEVMVKVSRPTGLIRYDSLSGIKNGKRRLWTPRTIAYTAVLTILMSVDIFLLASRSDVEATILRSPGQMYQRVDDDHISNLYTYQVVNKTHKPVNVQFHVQGDLGVVKLVGDTQPAATKDKMAEGAFFIEMDNRRLTGVKTTLYIEVTSEGKVLDKIKTSFVGPMSQE